MVSVIIRRAALKDAVRILELHRNSRDWFEIDLTENLVSDIVSRKDFIILVAEKDGEVLGFCGARYNVLVGRAEIGPVCVEDGNREKGTGSELLNQCLNYLAREGIHRTTAYIKSANKQAIKFFIDNEFSFECHLRDYTSCGEDAVQMVKFI